MGIIKEFLKNVPKSQIFIKNKKSCVYSLMENGVENLYMSYVINHTLCTIEFTTSDDSLDYTHPDTHNCVVTYRKIYHEDEYDCDTVIKEFTLEGVLYDTYYTEDEYW
jgi:hypothetical protein